MIRYCWILSVVLIAGCFSDSGGSGAREPETPALAALPPIELPAPLSPDSTWVIMGSSSAAGAGASAPASSWSGLLASEMEGRFESYWNIARGGYTTYHALSGSSARVSGRPRPDPAHNVDRAVALEADLVLLSFPSNDATQNYTVAETRGNLRAMHRDLVASGAITLVLSSQPRNDTSAAQVARQRALDEALQDDFGPCFVPVFDALATSDGHLDSIYDYDGVHLNDAGHWVIFEAVRDRIASNECVF